MRRPLATQSLTAVHVVPARRPAQKMSVEEYEPRSVLVVPEQSVAHARYAFVDIHGLRG